MIGSIAGVAAMSFGHVPAWLALLIAFIGACIINHAYRDKRK